MENVPTKLLGSTFSRMVLLSRSRSVAAEFSSTWLKTSTALTRKLSSPVTRRSKAIVSIFSWSVIPLSRICVLTAASSSGENWSSDTNVSGRPVTAAESSNKDSPSCTRQLSPYILCISSTVRLSLSWVPSRKAKSFVGSPSLFPNNPSILA